MVLVIVSQVNLAADFAQDGRRQHPPLPLSLICSGKHCGGSRFFNFFSSSSLIPVRLSSSSPITNFRLRLGRENLLLYCYPAVPHSVPLCALLQFAKVCLISQVGFSPEHQHWLPKQQAHFSVNRFDEDKHPTTYFSSYIRHVQLLILECE